MRVLHVITRLIRGGAQENTLATARLHRAAGVASEILHGPTDAGREGELLSAARDLGIPLHLLPALVREPDLGHDLRATLDLTCFLRQRPFDIVHTHTSKAGFIGRLAARLATAPAVVHTPHGHVFHSYYGPVTTRLFVRLERAAAAWADRLVALTRSERDEHLDYAIGDESRFTVVPSGIDLARFAERSGQRAEARVELGLDAHELVIGCVGRLAPVKGQETLLRALPQLLRRVPAVRLVLIGDGERREPLAQLTRELGVAGHVSFAGHRVDTAPLWPAFDAVAVPSLNEGMGRVVLEAMASRVPVVASGVGGIPDLIEPGHSGWLVPPGDPPALADALAGVLLDPGRTRAMVEEASRRLGPHWSQQAMADRLLAIYRELLAR